MKTIFIKVKIITVFILLIVSQFFGMIILGSDLFIGGRSKTVIKSGIINTDDMQLSASNNFLASTKKRAEEFNKEFVKRIENIDIDISNVQSKIKNSAEKSLELLNKKLSILNSRKQTISSIQELWRIMVELLEKQIVLLKASLEYKQTLKKPLNIIYEWKDFQDSQVKFSERIGQLNAEKRQKEIIKRQLSGEKETLLSLQKQLDIKNKEREKLSELYINGNDGLLDSSLIKLTSEIFEHELSLLKEQIEHSKLKIEKLDIEDKYKSDEIVLWQLKLDDEKELLSNMEKRLVLDYNDVEIAKAASRLETQSALHIKEKLNKERYELSLEKEKEIIKLEGVRKHLKDLNEKEKAEYIKKAVLKARIKKIDTHIKFLEKKIQHIDAQKSLADVTAKIKEGQALAIEVRYKLSDKKTNVQDFLTSFKTKRDIEIGELKKFKDYRQDAQDVVFDNKIRSESIKKKITKLKSKKIPLFKNKINVLKMILSNYIDAERMIIDINQTMQDYGTLCSDIISNQETVINNYDSIINDLETQLDTQNIWQRSSQSISITTLKSALQEAENVSKKFFWETPSRFSIAALFNGIKKNGKSILIFLLLLILIFFLLFFSIKLALKTSLPMLMETIELCKSRTKTLYLISLQAVLLFIYDNLSLILLISLLITNVVVDIGKLINYFSSIIISSYYKSFILLSLVPFLIYLSNCFVMQLKKLNKNLNFLFFTENFQNKFVTLLSCFFYAISVFLPLKYALVFYDKSATTQVCNVLSAGYSLFILLVFLLFFSKNSVLKVIPPYNSFFIWIKNIVDHGYYYIFFFVTILLILSNRYVGYLNLAWYLAFVVPASVIIFWFLFFAHNLTRKHSVFIFMHEDDIKNKFEHAKTYYGFFVIVTFLLFLFITIIALAKIWRVDLSPSDLWSLLAEKWVIQLDINNKLGFVQFMIWISYFMGGFLVSSLIHKFILTKLFDILRTEPGLQNTVSRVLHYFIISLSTILGFLTIHVLERFMLIIGSFLALGVGFAIRDVFADLIGGFLVLLERHIEIGNYIAIDNLRGTVHKIAARTTTIITSKNHSVVIPNRELTAKIVSNWGRGRFAVGFELNIFVHNDNLDPEFIKRVLSSILQSSSAILKLPPSIIRLESLQGDVLHFLVRPFISARRVKEQWEISSQIRFEILRVFKEKDIKLALPINLIKPE